MPLGVLTEEEFNSELSIYQSVPSVRAPQVEIIPIKRGRGSVKEQTDEIRAQIAETAITEGNQVAMERFGVSQSSISAYKNGATSTATYDQPNSDLAKENEEVKSEIRKQARDRLKSALSQLTPERIGIAKTKDISTIAKDMSAVIKNMEPTSGQSSGTQVIVYQPRMRDEDEFTAIVINE